MLRLQGSGGLDGAGVDAGRSEPRPYKPAEKNAGRDAGATKAQLRFGGVDGFAFHCVGVVFGDALGVEDHGGAFVGGEFGPGRQAGVIWVAGAGEGDPGGGDFLGQGLGFGAVAGHGFGAGLIVEAERDFGAVEGAGRASRTGVFQWNQSLYAGAPPCAACVRIA